ncbi:MAG TPA: hypothetical protein V6D28_22080 [Leptolyngbyaceae cyanobacterium]
MTWFVPIISAGIEIIGSLINGYSSREQQKLDIIAYENQARLEMERMQLKSEIDKNTKEHNLVILKGILAIIHNLTRTDIELKLLVERVETAKQMQIGDWIMAKKREICQLNNEQIRQLEEFLNKAKSLDESDQDKFKALVYENFEYNKKSIIENNNFLVKQAENLAARSGVELISLKEEFKQLVSIDTLKLLENYPK